MELNVNLRSSDNACEMKKFNSQAIIEVVAEKNLRNIPSKGRNQWELLKQFRGKSVASFVEAAKAKTRQVSTDVYQSGDWWNRELAYNVEKKNIVLKTTGSMHAKVVRTKNKPGVNSAGGDTVSGIYVVTLNNDRLISSRADDLRYADRAVKVNKAHCKFGKARNLEARRRNYYKTFGEKNVNYFPLATLDHIDEVEKAVLRQLADYKITGPAGRKTEWLTGIEKDEVVVIALATLEKLRYKYRLL